MNRHFEVVAVSLSSVQHVAYVCFRDDDQTSTELTEKVIANTRIVKKEYGVK